ncbi:hypothetical protein IH781_01695 [Patescibacteria group bacterium]|nr:hypothetical protein [Patescibacteria group bacterium]
MISSKEHLPTIILALALLLVPVAIWFESAEADTWQARLLLPKLALEPDRHTPRLSSGTFLPPEIGQDLTLTPQDNPIIIAKTSRILPGVTVTIQPGTRIFAHEFSSLLIEGTLSSNGTAQKPVTFTSNERHPDNQIWAGLVFAPDSQSQLSYTDFSYATPAITCQPDSQLTANHITIEYASLGLFTESPTCQLINSVIKNVRDGVISLGFPVQFTNTKVFAQRRSIREISDPAALY